MNNSVAVFSNQGDPFPAQPRNKTYYRPSPPQPLTSEQKQIVLSPVRLSSLPAHLSDALSPPDLSFLGRSQQLVPGLPESDSSGPFDESWPSSEGSSSKTPERSEIYTTGLDQLQKDPAPAVPAPEDSVIARYMARFRSGRPTSRLERSPPKEDTKEFWWLQTSQESPDTERLHRDSGMRVNSAFSLQDLEKTPPQQEESLNESKSYLEDVDTIRLQKRAEKLILQSESSLSSVGAVSSDGLTSSPLSSISCPESEHSRPKLPLSLQAPSAPIQRPVMTLPQKPVRAHTTQAPEDDILYQWRLRRKMEQAREGTFPLPTRGRTPSPPACIPKQAVQSGSLTSVYPRPTQKTSQGPLVPSPQSEQTQASSTSPLGFPISSPALAPLTTPVAVPPHLHLTCDLLPCVHSQHVPPCSQQTQKKVSEDVSKKIQSQTSESIKQGQPQLHVPELSALAVDNREQTPAGKLQKETSTQTAGKKDLRRPERLEEKRGKHKAQRVKKSGGASRQEEQSATRHVEVSPPGSPLHRVMGEVISERLFSPQEPPRRKSEITKPPLVTAGHPKPPDPQPEPLEVAAQLLEQAEDSDGTEFEDDPLLRVLRQQREVLRMKLRDVDCAIAEMESESQADLSVSD